MEYLDTAKAFLITEYSPICLLGRKSPSMPLNDSECSRLHALIFRNANGSLSLIDLNSRNGTFVNGQRVKTLILREGDQIRLGKTFFAVSRISLDGEYEINRLTPQSAPSTKVRNQETVGELLLGWPAQSMALSPKI